MTKESYYVPDWKKYNQKLVSRGSLTLWIDEETIKEWHQGKQGKRGRPERYSSRAIECGLTLKILFRLTFRMTEGFLKSLRDLLKLDLEIPSYSLLCKRQRGIKVAISKRDAFSEGLHIVIDTTGLKVYGEGEWKVRQYGWLKHRLWRKLHLGINSKTQEIEGFELTELGVQDCEGLKLISRGIKAPIKEVIGDGTYDRFSCYEEAERKGFKLITPPQRNARTSKERTDNRKKASNRAVEKRDMAIEEVRILGRAGWKIKEGYHKRSLAETGMYRMKGLLGANLMNRKMIYQRTEVAIRCKIINKMTALGMPNSIKAS